MKHTILVVDDEPMILRLLDQLLTDAGYRVLIALAPEAALSISSTWPDPIDVLVTDFLMPSPMSGRDLGEALARQRPSTRVLLMSAYADAAAATLIAHPDWGFIPKPFALHPFLELVGPLVSSAGAGLPMPATR